MARDRRNGKGSGVVSITPGTIGQDIPLDRAIRRIQDVPGQLGLDGREIDQGDGQGTLFDLTAGGLKTRETRDHDR